MYRTTEQKTIKIRCTKKKKKRETEIFLQTFDRCGKSLPISPISHCRTNHESKPLLKTHTNYLEQYCDYDKQN